MCKNPNTPCPGCKKQKTTDAFWTFFAEEEREAIEALKTPLATLDAPAVVWPHD